ncbi:MAG: Hsp20/alpha crystallin family protein [Balneolales bacterium]|nr:Hsp20/alpha crystallin family protein [Balneolales bacterium]
MTLVRFRNPSDIDNTIPRTFSQMLDTFFEGAVNSPVNGSFKPVVDVTETDKNYQIQVALPGMKKDDVSIELEDNSLTIAGERNYRKEEEGRKFHLVETSYGKFARTFTLPRNVNRESIEATMEDGILTLTIHKSEEAVSRKIQIS